MIGKEVRDDALRHFLGRRRLAYVGGPVVSWSNTSRRKAVVESGSARGLRVSVYETRLGGYDEAASPEVTARVRDAFAAIPGVARVGVGAVAPMGGNGLGLGALRRKGDTELDGRVDEERSGIGSHGQRDPERCHRERQRERDRTARDGARLGTKTLPLPAADARAGWRPSGSRRSRQVTFRGEPAPVAAVSGAPDSSREAALAGARRQHPSRLATRGLMPSSRV